MPKITQIKKAASPFIAKKRVAAYARVSVEGENNLHSLQSQISYFTNIISSRSDWLYAGVFSDYGITGTKIERDGMQELLSDCEKGLIDIILTKSISRFARNTVDLLQTVRHLKELNIPVIFEREKINTLTSGGELLLTLLASFAEEEARSISENTKWAIRKRFEEGIAQPHIIFGYRWHGDSYKIVEKEALIVQEIFSLYIEENSPAQIANILNQKNYKSYHGGYFSGATIWDMIRQEKYTGRTILQKTYYPNFLTKQRLTNKGELPRFIVEDAFPQIISDEVFNKAQILIAQRSTQSYRLNKNVKITCFSGIVKCANCGATFRRHCKSRFSKDRTKQTKYYYWICGTRLDNGGIKACNADNVPETVLYDATSKVLKMGTFTTSDFENAISKIEVLQDNKFRFHLKNGKQLIIDWKEFIKKGAKKNA